MALNEGVDTFRTADFHGLYDRCRNIIDMSDSTKLDSGANIGRSAFCSCSNPKDRIYAILSLLHEKEKGLDIGPDYTKTTAQVYQGFVLRYIECLGSLELLAHCDLQNDRPVKMPTLVPNWNVASAIQPMVGNGMACGISDATVIH